MVEEKEPKANETTENLKDILIKKEKADKSVNENNKQKAVHEKKQKADPSYRAKFVKDVLTKIPEIIVAEKGNTIVLKWNNKSICRSGFLRLYYHFQD